MKKNLTLPFIERYCCLVMDHSSGNGLCISRSLISRLEIPRFRAFKLRNIVKSFVISGRLYKIFFSKLLSSSQSNFPIRYRGRTDRFPCEKTIQRRNTDFSLSIETTTGYDSKGPWNEVKASDRLETSKMADGDSVFIHFPRFDQSPR